ncbi:MAG: leucyl aminopeptidase [bacterium]|nr:leucyl aminopeptidase [bacterium]
MQIHISRDDPCKVKADGLVVTMTTSDALPRALRSLDEALDGQLSLYVDSGDFTGKSGQMVRFPASGIGAERVLLVGLGKDGEVTSETLRAAAGRAIRSLARSKGKLAAFIAPSTRRIKSEGVGQALAEGAILGTYTFERYKTGKTETPELDRLNILTADAKQVGGLRKGAKLGAVLAESTNLARDLSNEPGSVLTPEAMAKQARTMGRDTGLKVSIYGPKELEKHEMGGILAVGRGSANSPRLIIMEHGAPTRGARRRKRVALVGKGITFDTGGVSLKPGAAMDEMKHDMSGGGAVIGAMRAIALLKLPLHVIGIVAAAENAPDGNAYLPGDIVKTASGKTIEVLNTDAEGRIVLSDALHYAREQEPDAIIDLATLTGACVVALGDACCAVMGNDDKLVDKIQRAGDRAHERAWPMPLWSEHKKAVEGTVGDIKNTGGRAAGTLTAGAFLSNFVGDIPWAHLDIAGTAWTTRERPYNAKGATGFGVRLLLELLRSWK